MTQISKYMLRQLLVSTTVVTIVMTGVIWLFVSVRAIEGIVNKGLSIKLFLTLTVLQLPNFLIQILPIALFISVIFVYNRLISDREIVILRAAGLSPLRLAQPVIILGLVFTALGYFLAVYATPKSYQKFRDLQWDIRYSFSHVLLREGVFNSITKNITVYIRERTGNAELKGLLIHDNRNKSKPATVIAERGVMVESPTGARVIMFDGNRQEKDAASGKLSILYFDRYSFDLSGVSQKPASRYREPRERMVGELLALKMEDVGNPKDFGRLVVEVHQRLSSPINALGFALIAVVALTLGGYSRHGQLRHILIASAIFVFLQVVNLGMINLTAKNLQYVPVLYFVTFVPAILSLLVLIIQPKIRFRGFGVKKTAEFGQA